MKRAYEPETVLMDMTPEPKLERGWVSEPTKFQANPKTAASQVFHHLNTIVNDDPRGIRIEQAFELVDPPLRTDVAQQALVEELQGDNTFCCIGGSWYLSVPCKEGIEKDQDLARAGLAGLYAEVVSLIETRLHPDTTLAAGCEVTLETTVSLHSGTIVVPMERPPGRIDPKREVLNKHTCDLYKGLLKMCSNRPFSAELIAEETNEFASALS
jgi:hypothetical protein